MFAAVIGVVFLHERLSLARLGSIAATLIGTTLLKLNGSRPMPRSPDCFHLKTESEGTGLAVPF